MTASLSRSLGFGAFPSASIKIHPDHLLPQSTSIPTLRRTLSADMSSKKWTSQNTIKKVPSLENLHFHDDNQGGAFEEIWSSIQREKKEEEMAERPKQTADIWSSIISQKENEDESKQGSVYVHPLVKRSASTLSEKSLEICTESLGSETGSDVFSFLEQEEELKHEATKEILENEEEEIRVSTVRCVSSIKKSASASLTARSFPPPLPSLAHRGEGSNVEMRSHRQDGRLVLETVSVPTHACLKAERQDGRLLLLFSGSEPEPEGSEPETDEEEEEVVLYDEGGHQQGDAMQEDEEGDESEQEEEDEVATNGEIIYSSLGHKFLDLTRNSAPVWPRRLNKVVTTLDDEEEDDVEEGYVEVGQAMMKNPYVYSWRSKAGPAVVAVAKGKEHDEKRGINKLLKVDSHYGKVVEVVVDAKRAGKGGEDLVPLFLKGCNLQQKQQPAKKSSLLLWEPRCIAT